MAASVEGQFVPGYIAPNSVYDQRDIYHKVFNRHREETLFDYLLHSNRRMKTDATTFNWFEDDFLRSSGTIESFTGGASPAATAVITYEEADHQESGTLSPGKVKDQIVIYNATSGPTQCYITAKSTAVDDAHTITVKPVDATIQLDAVIANADLIGYLSSGAGDGSGMVASGIRKPLTFSNVVQIIKTQFLAYGSVSADKVTFESKGGKRYFTYKGAEDADLDHRLSVEYALLIGEGGATDLVDPDNSESVNLTTGVEGFIDTYGNNEPYTTNFAETDLDNIIKYLDGQRAPEEHLLLAGVNLNLDIDSWAKGQYDQGGGFDFSNWGNGSEDMRYVDFGFDYFRKGNFVFHKKKFGPFNYAPVTGLTGSPYPDMGFTIPLMKVKNPGKDGPGEYDSISLRYKAWDRENRFVKSWVRDEEITNLDQIEFNNKSEVGLMFPCSNMANKLEKT